MIWKEHHILQKKGDDSHITTEEEKRGNTDMEPHLTRH